MKRIIRAAAAIFFAACLVQAVGAATVSYTLDDLGYGSWQYNYTITNDDMATPIANIDIFFDYNLYDNLAVTAFGDWTDFGDDTGMWGDDWFLMWSSPNSIFNMDGILALIGFGSGIDIGDYLTGFSVSFDWLGGVGTMPAGNQMVVFWDANFSYLGDGYTSPDVPAVPEPQTFLLLGTGLLGFAAYCRRKQAQKAGKR
jgi:hypothetical protein